MTTTELIELLTGLEFGASGRPREISLYVDRKFLSSPDISFNSSGDGVAGAELCLAVRSRGTKMEELK